jgi:hypothetical protein
VDKRVLLKHTGSYAYDFAQQESLYKSLHELAQKNIAAAAPIAPEEPVEPRTIVSSQSE